MKSMKKAVVLLAVVLMLAVSLLPVNLFAESFQGVTVQGVSVDENNDDYLRVEGNKILDVYGNEVFLTGIAWFGYETPNECFHGLWSQNMELIIDRVADCGFNLLRIPLSVQMVNQWRNGIFTVSPAVNIYENPGLEGKNTLEVLDAVIAQCKLKGIKVMLDMHRVVNGYQTNTWYTGSYTDKDFEECWKWLATHYKNDDTVIAMDLFNEPHGKPFLGDGAKWDSSTDKNNWKYAAERVGKAVLDINPNLLLVVEGVEVYPKEGYDYTAVDHAGQPSKYYYNWWGGNLRGVKEHPVKPEGYEGKVVYSPHDYGPSVWQQPWFYPGFNKDTLYKDVWGPNWFYIHENNLGPVLVGEWGGKLEVGDTLTWLSSLAEFIDEKQIHHTFWCVNPNSADTAGILLDDWDTVDIEKYNLVKPTLWQNSAGKFIGLDHRIPLGNNGITVSEYYSANPQPTPATTPPPTTSPQVIQGDVNGDGVVNSTDLTLMKRYVIGIINDFPVENDLIIADVSGDKVINSTDYTLMKRYILNIIKEFPAAKL
ncbi:MAG: cellulase family glycosylhydrolase [Bacillota bacterium]